MNVTNCQGSADCVDLCAHYLHDNLCSVPRVTHIKINGTSVVFYKDSGFALDQYTHLKNLFPNTQIELVGE